MINKKDQTVAVVGAGLIGCSWAAYYAAHGLKVRVCDVQEGYQEKARARISSLAAELPNVNPNEALKRMSFFTSIEEALEGVELIQENGNNCGSVIYSSDSCRSPEPYV